MDYKKLVDTAILAGEIMLKSNAETYRIEDVMNRILDISKLETTEAIVITTGLFVTLDDPTISAITVVKRITSRDTNLNNIAKVNSVSRNLTSGKYTLDEAYNELKNVDELQYSPITKAISSSLVAAFFTLLLGGGITEAFISWLNGVIMLASSKIEEKVNVGFFVKNVLYSTVIVIGTNALKRYVFPDINSSIIISGSIMPLVPGTAITNAFRDTLRGDYMSSGARALEAIVIALSIAVGVALGLIIYGGVI